MRMRRSSSGECHHYCGGCGPGCAQCDKCRFLQKSEKSTRVGCRSRRRAFRDTHVTEATRAMTTLASAASPTARGAVRASPVVRASRSEIGACVTPRRPQMTNTVAIASSHTRGDASRRGSRLVMSASKGDRVSVGDMKRALQNAGVDTSTCFERSDLEQKFVLLSDSEKKNVSDGETKSGSSSQSTRAESSPARTTASTV